MNNFKRHGYNTICKEWFIHLLHIVKPGFFYLDNNRFPWFYFFMRNYIEFLFVILKPVLVKFYFIKDQFSYCASTILAEYNNYSYF